MSRHALWFVVVMAGHAFAAPAQPEDVVPPAPERGSPLVGTLPAVPPFELPPAEPGFQDPKRLRVQGRSVLDTKVKVKGYIIWIYDCVSASRKAKETAAATQKRIDEDPTLCEIPKLYLGSTKTTPLERGLWVVDVPRPPNKLEKQRLPKEDLKNWPKVPKFKVGDYVVVTGDFKIRSPHNEANSDGLIVFESLVAAKPGKLAPAPATKPWEAVARERPNLKPARLALIEPAQRGVSMTAFRNGAAAHAQRQYEVATKHFQDSVKAWPQNHISWYSLGGTLAGQGMWEAATDAFAKALAVHPEQGMYQLWFGVSAYEQAVQTARADQAARSGRKPEEIVVDVTSVNFDKARDALELAVALEPTLWRAHYYLGRIHRAANRMREAAAAFSEALIAKSTEQGPWVALAELYRKWDYTEESIDVATLGTKNVADGPTASDISFVLGMAYDDKNDHAHAIEAFTKALELKADNHKAKFQRGQSYFRSKKYTEARADLEAFLKSAGPALEFAKQQANKMLMDIETKPKKK